MSDGNPMDRLRHHVTGAIERGEKVPIVEEPAAHVRGSAYNTLTLQFGANQYVIPGLRAAWGCRLIVRQDGDVDFVPDRQSGAVLDPDNADHQRLLEATMEWVRTGAADGAFKNISKCLREGVMQTRERQGVWVFEDEHGIVLANTNASAGYCYVVGWIFDALPEGHTTKGADLLVEELHRGRE